MEQENNQVFREKSVERLSSPEQLNDYIRVSNPSVWMCLGAIIILLAGVCVWGVFGRLSTTLSTAAIAKDGSLICLVREEDFARIQVGMAVSAGGQSTFLTQLSDTPVAVSNQMDPYVLHLGELSEGDWVYMAAAPTELPDGTYTGVITIESIAPMSFALN